MLFRFSIKSELKLNFYDSLKGTELLLSIGFLGFAMVIIPEIRISIAGYIATWKF